MRKSAIKSKTREIRQITPSLHPELLEEGKEISGRRTNGVTMDKIGEKKPENGKCLSCLRALIKLA